MRRIFRSVGCLILGWSLLPASLPAQSPAAWLARGDEWLARGESDSAEVCYQLVADQAPPGPRLEAVARLIRVALQRTEMAVADSLLRLGATLSRQPAVGPVARGEFLLSRGEYLRENSELEAAFAQHRDLADWTAGQDSLARLHGYALFYAALTLERLAVYDSSLLFAERAYSVLRRQLDTTALEFSAIYNGLGVTHFRANRLAEAKRFFLRSKAIAEATIGPRSEEVAICLNNLSAISRSAGNYPEAIAAAQRALDIYRALRDESGAAGALYSLGVYHYYQGDYGRTKDLIEACIEIRERLYGPDHYSLISPYQLLGIAYEESGDYDRTLYYLRQGREKIIANYPPNSLPEGFNYENAAVCFVSTGQLDSALYYQRLAHAILPGQLPENDYALATHYYSYAKIHYERKEWAAAQYRLDQANRIGRAAGAANTEEYAQNLALGALISAGQGDWRRADAQFARALSKIRSTVDTLDFRLTPNALSVLNEYSDYLYRKYAATGDPATLTRFDRYAEAYLVLSDRFRRQFIDPYTKSVLSKDNAEVYGRNIGIYYKLYRATRDPGFLRTAYRFSEYGRACLLRDLQDDKIRAYAGLPDTLLRREAELKKEIARLNERLLDQPAEAAGKQRLFRKKEALQAHIDHIERYYPAYFDLMFRTKVPELSTIQSRLPVGQNLIEYMQDDTAYYALVIRPDRAVFLHLGSRRVIDAAIGQWTERIMARDPRAKTVTGPLLYRLLWQPLEDDLAGDRVTIVPTGPLFYLNFETLPDRRHRFLIERYTIAYAISLTTLFAPDEPAAKGPLLTVVPGFEPDLKRQYLDRLDSLTAPDQAYLRTVRQPWSLRLAQQLADQYALRGFTGARATETNIKAHLSEGSVLYFGTHAVADPDDPLRSKLILAKTGEEQPPEDGYLHAYEIYGIPLRAKLAVLNACESGLGNLRKGEGMISLAYSVQFAGCPSTVLSLWKVDERVSTGITRDFLAYTAQGYVYSDALRLAKLDYLRQADTLLQHPFYWGGMVLMGKDRTVELTRAGPDWLLLSAGGLLLVALGLVSYRLFGRAGWKTRGFNG